MPPSRRTRPAPIVSGSSVTNGRCCASAGTAQTDRANTLAISRVISIDSPQEVSGSRLRLLDSPSQDQRHGAVGERGVAQLRQGIETSIEEVAAGHVAERADHRVLDLGMLDFEPGDEPLDALPLQAQVAAGRTAAA